MIPLKDNLRYLSLSWVSVLLFALNVFVYVGQLTLNANADMMTVITHWMTVRDSLLSAFTQGHPGPLLHGVLTLFASMFMHGSFMHIFGNMCFFFTFAPALEARMGHMKFLAFYLVSGLVAALTYIATDSTGITHALGASGAIGGVLGAYVIYFPRARVNGWSPLLTPLTSLAVFFLADFFLMQWVSIITEGVGGAEAAGVGYWAHVGGMTFGMIVGALMALSDAGRLEGRYLHLYLLSAIATVGAFMAGGTLAYLVLEVVAFIAVPIIYTRYIAPGPTSRRTALRVTAVFFILGFCVDQLLAAWGADGAAWRQLHIGLIAGTLWLVAIFVAVAARRLPLTKKPIVIVPVPKEGEKILAEQFADAIIGFFHFIGTALVNTRHGVGAVASLTADVVGRGVRNGKTLISRAKSV